MEENVAIMIADLSGYTALTETHGASGAADLIDIFEDMVHVCLVGDSHLHQRTGDEILVVSSSADHLMATLIMLIQTAGGQNNFLQLHGGLHYGKILRRNNDYFGTTINLTARIAANANAGSFCCSREFKNVLQDSHAFRFHSKGKWNFRNLSDETEVFELGLEKTSCYIDPVCRMLIREIEKATTHPKIDNLYFCSSDCLEIYFKKNGIN